MTFVPSLPNPRTFGQAVPPLLDLTGREPGDDADVAAVRVARELPGAVALWRAWWLGAPEPERVFVLETADGQAVPGMRVYRTGEKPTVDVRAARNAGALLWTAAEPHPIRVAKVFDVVDDRGARFEPGHELLTGADRGQVVTWLDAGAPVFGTGSALPDVVEPSRGAVVPMTYRTDGRWLWTESVTYYVRTYGLAPDPALLTHVRAAGTALPTPDAADEHRALALLLQSAAFVQS
nr:hypothetical protein [Actinoplanes consettensis]